MRSTLSTRPATRVTDIHTRSGHGCASEAPVAHFAPDGYEPFWAITKHADILEISKAAASFLE